MRGDSKNDGVARELYLKAVLESMDTLFIFVDTDFNIITCNKAMADGLCKVFGRTPKQGDSFRDFVLNESLERATERLNRALAGETVNEEQHMFVPVFDRAMWFTITYNPVFDDSGKIIGVAVHYRDIDKVKSTENQAIEKEYQLFSALESMFTSFAFFDTKLRLVRCSTRFRDQVYNFLGKQVEYGTHTGEYIPYKDHDKVIERMNRALAGEEVQVECTFYHPKEKRETWSKQFYYPVYNNQKELIGIAYQGLSINDQKEAELEIRRNYERFATVLRASHDAVWEMDFITGVVTRNENFALLFGYEPEEQNQRFNWWEKHIHPDDKEEALHIFETGLNNRKSSISMEYRFRCLDGTYKYVKDSFCINYDDAGMPTRLVGSMQDIDRLVSQRQTLIKQNTLLRELAHMQSHMIRKPVANMIGLFQLLEAELDTGENQGLKEYMSLFRHSIVELDKMVRGSINALNEGEKDNLAV